MKKIFILQSLSVFLLFILTVAVMGQNAFNVKKKNITPVNTSSLNAKKINGSVNGNSANYLFQSAFNNQLKSTQNSVRPLSIDKNKKVIISGETNLPIFIQSDPDQTVSLKSSSQHPSVNAFNYLNELKPLLNIEFPEENFRISRINTDETLKTHIRFDQIYKGIKVFGSEVMVHLNQAGKGEIFNGRYVSIKNNVDTFLLITASEAINKAETHLLNRNKKLSTLTGNELPGKLEKPESELVIYKPANELVKHYLTFHFTLFTSDHHRWEYFVDAQSGKVLHFIENTCYADGARTASANDLNGVSRTVNTYLKGSLYYLIDVNRAMINLPQSQIPDDPKGAIITIDMNNTYGNNQSFTYITTNNNIWNNPTAVSAHYNAGVAYEYYRTKHNRNSIDGNGGNIISIINVPDQETGDPLDNAFWNGRFMSYGNGNVSFNPLAAGMDVAGHEMTHGVVENTAALIYEGESGAMNESMADIFGAMMDDEDWQIGEDVVKTSVFLSGALRDLSDPHNGGTSLSDRGYQPKHMNEKYLGEADNFGVHINSGIPNHAFYLFATAIGKDKAAEIYYKALSDYLTKSSQFIDLRLAVVQAATDLYGATSNEVNQAKTAFNSVGITDGQGNEDDPALPENPGDEYVLVYNTDLADANTLYRSNLSQTVLDPLTTTTFLSRPSVTDDGNVAVFVAGDNTIHAIITTPGASPDEFIIREEPIWSNVVVSKDGNRLAAVTTVVDTAIYVYDFISDTWGKYTIYSPTYTEGIEAAGPLYADALEFDYSGEFLVYDAFNSLENNSGANIEYWDVNFIRVWDKSAEDFGDGTVFKLFSSIPDNVSIGNPAFSKNSPNILAFDYLNSDPVEYYILGCNIETNEVNTIIENNTVGWPSFNKDDSRVAYTSLDLSDDPKIDYALLNADKISSNGIANPMFTGAMWPVYFSTGERVISSIKNDQKIQGEIKCYPNPFSNEITIVIPEELSGNGTIQFINYTGQVVYSSAYQTNGEENINLNLESLERGYYFVKLSNKKAVAKARIVKLD